MRKEPREELGLPAHLFSLSGALALKDQAAFEQLAGWLRQRGSPGLGAARLSAAATLHELQHVQLQQLSATGALDLPFLLTAPGLTARSLHSLAVTFGRYFPPGNVSGAPLSLPAVLEESLLLRLHNLNPALQELAPLLNDRELLSERAYSRLDGLLTAATKGGADPLTGTDLSALRTLLAAQETEPHSLSGQLRFLQQQLGSVLTDSHPGLEQQLLLALAELGEAGAARFSPGPPGPPSGAPAAGSMTLPGLHAAEQRAADEAWMTAAVMVAKSCLVWLQQLSDRFGEDISTLDRIPEVALQELADSGFTVLWLIGLWKRSPASKSIKRRRGQPDAEASAYSIAEYVIEPSLGGEAALAVLRDRAARCGLRLAGDMVPNHTGLDSRWVAEHPDRFIQVDRPPFSSYSFSGPDLSADPRMEIRLEDHYWDGSDAAVVFERRDTATGERRYIYHGNDGTGLPWNDTAQLDYLQPEVRSAVIDTMVQVARSFPVIRFDAAMTLVRRHVRRLWYPPPGEAGAVASRARHGAMSDERFGALLDGEFWSEATARLSREAPGTLLIAEAFWMLEGYFVRNLGMHRVYSSAFMHMLRDGDNAGFREFLARNLATDPASLARFVNFMNNPDEESAAAQFGTGDRYFAVCTLLSTLPGLPMFGHGQVEGLSEKYGMEFRAARTAETVRADVAGRHASDIFPLLRRRSQFAAADRFELFEVSPDSPVVAFSNGVGRDCSVVAVNNSAAPVTARLHMTVPRLRPDGSLSGSSLFEAVGSAAGVGELLAWRDSSDGCWYVRSTERLQQEGLTLQLAPWQARVLLDLRFLADGEGVPYSRLGDGGYPDLAAAAESLALQPLRDWLLNTADGGTMEPPQVAGLSGRVVELVRDRSRRLRGLAAGPLQEAARQLDGPLTVWLLVQGLPGLDVNLASLAPGAPVWLPQQPQRHVPARWSAPPVRDWLHVHEHGGEEWFRQEQSERLAAALAFQGGLKAGPAAGAELWAALQAAARFSGWRWPRLLRAAGVRSDG